MLLNNKSTGEFYRGKRKRVGPAVIFAIIAIIVIAFIAMMFYGLQKYIIITNDGVKLDIPIINGGSSMMKADDEGNVIIEYEKVNAELVVGEADYSNVMSSAGDDVKAIKAKFIYASNLNESTVNSCAGSLGECNAVVLELKPSTGKLAWKTGVDFANAYGLNGETDLKPIISSLKDKDVYVAVQLNCFVDSALAEHYSQMKLKTDSGMECIDGAGTWLDPYNNDLRSYIIALCRELDDMGVDEIILSNVKIPSADVYTYAFGASTSSAPNAVSAVSGFALDVTRALKSCNAKISVRCDSETALTVGEDLSTGQNAELLFKVFDRVYCYTSADKVAELSDAAKDLIEVGSADERFVPVCSGETPQTPSWVSAG